ncbi:hypothetical protein ACWEFJ_29805 [Actinosynnema sp. NPDC004786]
MRGDDFDAPNTLLGVLWVQREVLPGHEAPELPARQRTGRDWHWPRIPPYVEIEDRSKDEVVRVSTLLGYAEEKLTGKNTIKVHALYGIDLNTIPDLRF